MVVSLVILFATRVLEITLETNYMRIFRALRGTHGG